MHCSRNRLPIHFAQQQEGLVLLQVLRNYGHKGRSVSKIVEEMSKKGLREFSNARNAKSSVASTCAHDAAFARVAPGTFALRSVPGVVEVTHSVAC